MGFSPKPLLFGIDPKYKSVTRMTLIMQFIAEKEKKITKNKYWPNYAT